MWLDVIGRDRSLNSFAYKFRVVSVVDFENAKRVCDCQDLLYSKY